MGDLHLRLDGCGDGAAVAGLDGPESVNRCVVLDAEVGHLERARVVVMVGFCGRSVAALGLAGVGSGNAASAEGELGGAPGFLSIRMALAVSAIDFAVPLAALSGLPAAADGLFRRGLSLVLAPALPALLDVGVIGRALLCADSLAVAQIVSSFGGVSAVSALRCKPALLGR
jgi:hypothetical protein